MKLAKLPPSLERPDLMRRCPRKNTPDLTGMDFTGCTVIGLAGVMKRCSVWLCRCKCGNQFLVRSQDLNRDRAHTCGCICGEYHGLRETQLYQAWCNMKQRCYNPNDRKYYRYGGRGISMCDAWRKSARVFIADVLRKIGPRPSMRHSIDRMNNNGNYEPNNIRWATPKQQANNRECCKRKSA